jgi:hypothetical protein
LAANRKRIKQEDKEGEKEGQQFDMQKQRDAQKQEEIQLGMQKKHVDAKSGKACRNNDST